MKSVIPPVHEAKTASGILLADPDQGTPFCRIELEYPGSYVDVWEPFPELPADGQEHGHNLYGLLERWQAWAEGSEPYLMVRDPRFGFPAAIPRAAIAGVRRFSIVYHRKEDTRAGHRSLAVPIAGGGMVREVSPGVIEVGVPRR
jgi:hypothetical protein